MGGPTKEIKEKDYISYTGFLRMYSGYNSETPPNSGRGAVRYCPAVVGFDTVSELYPKTS